MRWIRERLDPSDRCGGASHGASRSKVDAFETTVMLYRSSATVFAVADRCTHQGAPLDRGVSEADGF